MSNTEPQIPARIGCVLVQTKNDKIILKMLFTNIAVEEWEMSRKNEFIERIDVLCQFQIIVKSQKLKRKRLK